MSSAEQRRSLEEAIVDTVREPLIVLDDALRVVVASRSFYRAFDATRQETEGRSLYELGDGQWNIPGLRTLLEEIIPRHLRDAHERVMAIATVQEQLHPAPFGAQIEAKNYLIRLCESLAASMILDNQPVSINVTAGDGTVTSEQAVSMGLIATELVINSLKHAFPIGAKGTIIVGFESTLNAWRLFVSDDGVGIGTHLADAPARSGLGTSIVEALTRQLGGRVTTAAASPGTTVSVTVPRAA